MEFFDVFPLAGFLALAFMLTGRIIFLNKKSVVVRSNLKKSLATKLLLYPSFSLIFTLFFLELIQYAFRFSLFDLPSFVSNYLVQSKLLQILGVLLILIALILMGLTLLSFKNSFRFGTDPGNLGELVTTGAFAYSRNPFFVSIEIYFVGIAIIWPNLFFIAFTVLSIFSIHFFILNEEKFMKSNYRDNYDDYTKKVRRYF